MRYLAYILGCCLLCFTLQAKKLEVRLDSTKTLVKNAGTEKEKEVFSVPAFHYKADAKESKNWLEAFWEWLTQKMFGKVSAENADLTWQIVKWTLIALFIAGIIFVLWKSKFRGLIQKDAKNLSGAAFTDLPEDIESINLDRLINEALQNSNYRLAIRWCFLKSLQLLSQKKQITWQPSKTNVDYQYELSDREMRERFTKLSYVFEYVWYGELATSEQTFNQYRNDVEKFNSGLHA